MKFQVGDRVIYAHQNPGYGVPSKNNPLVGTEYFCGGRITKITELDPAPNDICVLVTWDNHGNNSYAERDLEFEDVAEGGDAELSRITRAVINELKQMNYGGGN